MSSAVARFGKSGHKSAAKMLMYALTADDNETWFATSAAWAARLSATERRLLATCALLSLDHEDAVLAAEAALSGAGMPQPALFDEMDQAAFWADLASTEEVEAYCLASFRAMPRGRQAAFLDYAQRRAA